MGAEWTESQCWVPNEFACELFGYLCRNRKFIRSLPLRPPLLLVVITIQMVGTVLAFAEGSAKRDNLFVEKKLNRRAQSGKATGGDTEPEASGATGLKREEGRMIGYLQKLV